MNATQAKAARRDLRRAIGPAALAAVDTQDQRIGSLEVSRASHEKILQAQASRIRALEGWKETDKPAIEVALAGLQFEAGALAERVRAYNSDRTREIDELALKVNTFTQRGLWSRLVWLITGR